MALHSTNVTTVWHNGASFDSVVLHHAMPGLEPAIEQDARHHGDGIVT
ncbi:MAG: hypothetical protein Q8O37_16035 [Sulfuricellaceae bacterium]|nr:hypothetical protein [Sulfuricellaceae bacterium]